MNGFKKIKFIKGLLLKCKYWIIAALHQSYTLVQWGSNLIFDFIIKFWDILVGSQRSDNHMIQVKSHYQIESGILVHIVNRQKDL